MHSNPILNNLYILYSSFKPRSCSLDLKPLIKTLHDPLYVEFLGIYFNLKNTNSNWQSSIPNVLSIRLAVKIQPKLLILEIHIYNKLPSSMSLQTYSESQILLRITNEGSISWDVRWVSTILIVAFYFLRMAWTWATRVIKEKSNCSRDGTSRMKRTKMTRLRTKYCSLWTRINFIFIRLFLPLYPYEYR